MNVGTKVVYVIPADMHPKEKIGNSMTFGENIATIGSLSFENEKLVRKFVHLNAASVNSLNEYFLLV